jgi:hypothetical protein
MNSNTVDDFPILMTEREAAKLLQELIGQGTSATLRRQRCVGGGPRFVKISRAVRYRKDDLLDYARRMISEPFASTAQVPKRRDGAHMS